MYLQFIHFINICDKKENIKLKFNIDWIAIFVEAESLAAIAARILSKKQKWSKFLNYKFVEEYLERHEESGRHLHSFPPHRYNYHYQVLKPEYDNQG